MSAAAFSICLSASLGPQPTASNEIISTANRLENRIVRTLYVQGQQGGETVDCKKLATGSSILNDSRAKLQIASTLRGKALENMSK
jgi:hypothetical protein